MHELSTHMIQLGLIAGRASHCLTCRVALVSQRNDLHQVSGSVNDSHGHKYSAGGMNRLYSTADLCKFLHITASLGSTYILHRLFSLFLRIKLV